MAFVAQHVAIRPHLVFILKSCISRLTQNKFYAIHSSMLWLVFTYSLWFLLKFDLISVTSILQAHNSEANTRRLCKAVIGLHPGAPHCEASFQDFNPSSYSLLQPSSLNLYYRVVGKVSVFFPDLYTHPHTDASGIIWSEKSIKPYLPAKKCEALY